MGVNYTNTEDAEQKIARVNNQSAFKIALATVEEGGTIVLEENIDLVHTGSVLDKVDTYITVPDVTIDLGGHTVTVTNGGDNAVFGLAANGIILKNGTITLSDTVNTSYPVFVTSNAKNVLIEDITVIGGVQVLGASTATLINVDITSTGWHCVYLEGSTCSVTIEESAMHMGANSKGSHICTAGSPVPIYDGTDIVVKVAANVACYDKDGAQTELTYSGPGQLIDNTLVSE